MTAISLLNIENLRNLGSLRLEPSPAINVIYGENGSGKTSLLEAIYLTGLGRSFRTAITRPLVTHGEGAAVVSCRLDSGLVLGIKKPLHGRQEVRVGGKTAGSAADLARELPIQLFNSDTFGILDGSPGNRRAYLDWGVFHVEHLFFGNWRHTLKSLKQRNALLKRQASNAELEPWNIEFARYGEMIDRERRAYLEQLVPVVHAVLKQIMPPGLKDIDIQYQRGWPEDQSLDECLALNNEKDRRYGYTSKGPHRADLALYCSGVPVVERLSRGQQKLLVCALKLAQTSLLKQSLGKDCIFLLDDLAAELDASNQDRICELLFSQEQQVFLTCIEPGQTGFFSENKGQQRLFHVKHGKISGYSDS